MSLLWNLYIFLSRKVGRERSFLNSSYMKSQIFNSNRTPNCFTMKELHFLVTWKFRNSCMELFLRILLSGPFWKYPSKQNMFKVNGKKNTGTTSRVFIISMEYIFQVFDGVCFLVKLQAFPIGCRYNRFVQL